MGTFPVGTSGNAYTGEGPGETPCLLLLSEPDMLFLSLIFYPSHFLPTMGDVIPPKIPLYSRNNTEEGGIKGWVCYCCLTLLERQFWGWRIAHH